MAETLKLKYGDLPAFDKIENDFLDSKIATEDEMYSKMINLAKDNYGGLDKLKYDTYQRLHGEQQARATEQRMNYTPEQRAKEDWTKTLEKNEGAYSEPIIKYDGDIAMSIEDVKSSFSSFKDLALKNKTFKADFDFGLLSVNSVNKLKDMTGLNFAGYKRVVDTDHIRHTKNSHPDDLKIYDDLLDIFENFDYARKTNVRDKATGKTNTGIELYRKHQDGLIEFVELRDFNNKELRLKTAYFVDEKMADQKLPKDLRLWTDADYRDKQQSPQSSRPKANSDGFKNNSISKNVLNSEINQDKPHTKTSLFEKTKDLIVNYDEHSDKFIDNLTNFFNATDKNGNVKQKTNWLVNAFRHAFVPNAFKNKEFVKLLQENKREENRIRIVAPYLRNPHLI